MNMVREKKNLQFVYICMTDGAAVLPLNRFQIRIHFFLYLFPKNYSSLSKNIIFLFPLLLRRFNFI